MSDTSSRAWSVGRLFYSPLFILLLLTLALGWPLLLFPLGLDQGIYAVNAARMLDGHPLYKEAWDMKSPGIFFMYLLPVSLGGYRVWPITVFHLGMMLATALLIHRLMRRLCGATAGWGGAIAWLFFSLGWGDPITNGQPDDWMLPFYLGALALLLAAWERPSWTAATWQAWLAGVLFGWVVILRSPMILGAPLLPLVWLAAPGGPAFDREGWRAASARAGRLLLRYVAGGLTAGVATLAYFVATGSVNDLIDCQLVWVIQYAQLETNFVGSETEALLHFFSKRWEGYFKDWGLLQAALYLGVGGAAWQAWRERQPWRAVVVWVVGLAPGLISLFIQRKFFNYHYWPLVAFLMMASGLGIVALGEIWAAGWRKAWAMAAGHQRKVALTGMGLALMGGLIVFFEAESGYSHVRKRQKQALEYVTHHMSEKHYIDYFNYFHMYRPLEERLIARHILKQTGGQPPRLYVWAFRPALYFLCGTPGPSRFPYNLPLRNIASPANWTRGLRAELAAEPPDYIVVGRDDWFPWVTGSRALSPDTLPPWLKAEMDAHFRVTLEFKHLTLWERVREAPPA